MADWIAKAMNADWGQTVLKTTKKNTRDISDPIIKEIWKRFEEEESDIKKFEYCSQLIIKDPKDYFAYLRAGDTLRELKQNDEAHEKYLKSLELSNRKCIEVLNNYGNFQGDLNNDDEAINLYDEGLKIDPKDTDLLYNKCRSLKDLEKYEEAIVCYDKALEINPKYYEAWNGKGNALRKLEKYEEAIDCYDKALEINPKNAGTLNSKSWTLCKLERYEEALLLSEISLAIKSTTIEYIHTKGFILLKLKQYQDAIKWFDKALAVDPNHKYSIKDRQLAVDAAKLDK